SVCKGSPSRGPTRKARPKSSSSRSRTGGRSFVATWTRNCDAVYSTFASSVRSRFATTRRSRPGTGCSSRRSPRPAGGLERRIGLEAPTRQAEFLLGPLSDDEGRLNRTYRQGQAKNTGFLEDYADVANGLYE